MKTQKSPAKKHVASDNAQSLSVLDELDRSLAVIRDRVRGVAFGHHSGFYVHGRPGTGKTFAVRRTLEDHGVRYTYHAGHLTPIGLFELISTHPDGIIVLDDLSYIFKQPIALQLVLACLGNQPSDRGTRVIRYKRQGQDQVVHFTGGIVGISNLEIHGGGLLAALKSRIHHLRFDPADEQIEALMLDIAGKGWCHGSETLTAAECHEIAEFLITESRGLDIRLDIRNLVDKAFPDYLQHRAGFCETHWKDLVCTTLKEQLVELHHTPCDVDGRDQRKLKEGMIVRMPLARYPSRARQLAEWKTLTGKSERAFYRRLADADGT